MWVFFKKNIISCLERKVLDMKLSSGFNHFQEFISFEKDFCAFVPLSVYIGYMNTGDLRGQKRALAHLGAGGAGSCEPLTHVLVLCKIVTEPSLQSQIHSALYFPF